MNILLFLFTIMTLGWAIGVSALPNDDLKYRILLRQAMLNMDQLDYQSAIVKLLEVQKNTEDNPNVTYLIGMCYLQGEHAPDKAAFYLNKVTSSVTDDYQEWDLDERRAPTKALYQLGKAYEELGEFAKASAFYGEYLGHIGTKEGIERSKMYALIKRSVDECQLAAARCGQMTIGTDNVAINK